jgi:hypothetical protein
MIIYGRKCEYALLGVNGNSCGNPVIHSNFGNVAFWPNLTVRTSTRLWHFPDFERQVTAQTRTYRLIQNKNWLKDLERPFLAIQP